MRLSADDYHAHLITLDVAVDLYGGDEIKRRQVRAFIRALMALARKIDGEVVLSGHISQAGLQSDDGHSGSTDWSNGVRSRLYLSSPKTGPDDPADPTARILTRKKANFATKGDTIDLHIGEGGILIDDTMKAGASQFGRLSCSDTFLALLDAVNSERQDVSWKKKAGNYAPALFMSRPKVDRNGYMQALSKAGAIKLEATGSASRRTYVIVRAAGANGENG